MSDVHTPAIRSKNMAAIRSRNTHPEMIVRRALHARGYRYSLHVKSLPGTPDLVFPRFSAVLFVHGCFWHGHNCRLFKWPNSRKEFWVDKISANMYRDIRDRELLEADWRIGVVWECAIRGKNRSPIGNIVSLLADWLHYGDQYIEVQGTVL